MSIPPSETPVTPSEPTPEARRNGPPTPGGRRERHQREQRLLKRNALIFRIAFITGLIVLGGVMAMLMNR